jgi:hypothetical protein
VGRLSQCRIGVGAALLAVVALATVGCDSSSSGDGEGKSTGKAAVQKFLDKLDKAVREGDTATRVALLHPSVIERYGEQQCRDFLASQVAQDPSRRDKVDRVDKPEPFEFTTDDGVIPIPNAQLVFVKETFAKNKGERELHVALVDRDYRYFIDCGTPLPRP